MKNILIAKTYKKNTTPLAGHSANLWVGGVLLVVADHIQG
jgi:hypothetical protein